MWTGLFTEVTFSVVVTISPCTLLVSMARLMTCWASIHTSNWTGLAPIVRSVGPMILRSFGLSSASASFGA